MNFNVKILFKTKKINIRIIKVQMMKILKINKMVINFYKLIKKDKTDNHLIKNKILIIKFKKIKMNQERSLHKFKKVNLISVSLEIFKISTLI